MQAKLNRFTQQARKSVRKKVSNHESTHSGLISIHRLYCNLTGFLHVLPDYYIIGGQKCGTGSLYTYLNQHPNIQPSLSKEPSYYDRYFDRGLNWYKVFFPFKFHKFYYQKILKKKFVTGEASVRYLDHPFTPKRLKDVSPNAKFIVLLRNPIDRAYSQYTRVSGTKRDSLSFEDAIGKENERTEHDYQKMISDEYYWPADFFRLSYLSRGIYVDKLKRWMEIFPKERFLILQSEEFFKNTSEVYKQVIEFLGLPKHELKEYRQIGKAKYKQEKMKPETRKKLIEYFKPHNQELYKFLGIEFDWDK
jgi:hypothetical protein